MLDHYKRRYMAKKQLDTNIPQHEIEALARCLLPEIQQFFESTEGKRNRNEKERMTKAAVSLTIPPLLL